MYKWRKQLIIIPAIGGVLAIIFSMPIFIKPLFESSVVVFPSTTNSVSKALMPQQNGYADEDILEAIPAMLFQGLLLAGIRFESAGRFAAVEHLPLSFFPMAERIGQAEKCYGFEEIGLQ